MSQGEVDPVKSRAVLDHIACDIDRACLAASEVVKLLAIASVSWTSIVSSSYPRSPLHLDHEIVVLEKEIDAPLPLAELGHEDLGTWSGEPRFPHLPGEFLFECFRLFDAR